MDHSIRKPTNHNMKRRSNAHDYRRSGYYHITISTATIQRQPLGTIAGHADMPDGHPDAPHVVLSPIGQMVAHELTHSIHHHYPMLDVQDYVIMPEHLHFILCVRSDIVSANGKPRHLGNVIAGFKHGCNKRFWAMTGLITAETPAGPASPVGPAATPVQSTLATESPGTVLGDSVAKPPAAPAGQNTRAAHPAPAAPLPPLFDAGYCDVMPIDEAQLATQRAYIRANPRSRLMRTTNRAWLQPRRRTVDTAVTINGLRRYLATESPGTVLGDSVAKPFAAFAAPATPAAQNTPTYTPAFAALAQRLLLADGHIWCDSYGNAALLDGRRLLPVVCHRRDAARQAEQKARCLAEAAAGAVLVSARIARGEQDIMDAARRAGYATVLLDDNGFPDIYHPSAERLDDCAADRLLLLTPWTYQPRSHSDAITVAWCKTMNCIAQAVCRLKDDWWR